MHNTKRVSPAALDFNLAQLLKQPTGAVREYNITADIVGLDISLHPVEPLTATVRLLRTQKGALMALQGHTTLEVPCSRCLTPVMAPIVLQFEEEFLQTIDIITGLPLGTSKDDPAILIDDHHDLHLADLVREYLLLAVPMRPLCREDCKGLCPQCGHNLNDGPCTCNTPMGDERWAALRSLLT